MFPDTFSLSTSASYSSSEEEEDLIGWLPRVIDREEADAKMERCLTRAISEREHLPSYVSIQEHAALAERQPYAKLSCLTSSIASQGRRMSMQDTHFVLSTKKGVLAAVFDGHGGPKIARKLKDFFSRRFFPELKLQKGNVFSTFEALFFEVSKEICSNKAYDKEGSTAVISYLSAKDRRIYTATVGDSEANLYRKIEGRERSLPLSRPLHWGHPKEAKRAEEALCLKGLAGRWQKLVEPKKIRFPGESFGVNMSRAVGDAGWNKRSIEPGIISKPSITCCHLSAGDYIILACDGIKDFIPEFSITQLVERHLAEEQAETIYKIAEAALAVFSSTDNVTAIGILVID